MKPYSRYATKTRRQVNGDFVIGLVLVAASAASMIDMFVRGVDSVYGHLFMAIVRCVS